MLKIRKILSFFYTLRQWYYELKMSTSVILGAVAFFLMILLIWVCCLTLTTFVLVVVPLVAGWIIVYSIKQSQIGKHGLHFPIARLLRAFFLRQKITDDEINAQLTSQFECTTTEYMRKATEELIKIMPKRDD